MIMKIYFEKGNYSVRKNRILEWGRARTAQPKGIVFVPPLIGGSFSQQIRLLRPLIKENYDIFSFNYSGHGKSSNRFSMGETLFDTFHMLFHIQKENRQHLPVFAAASCFSAIPLINTASYFKEPFKKIVLINPVTRFNPGAVARSFTTYYKVSSDKKKRFNIYQAAGSYVNFLFPEIEKNRYNFGILELKRSRILKILSEFLFWNPLKNMQLEKTPVLCLYAKNDRILKIYDSDINIKYEESIQKICKKTLFYPLYGDHFLKCTETRKKTMRSILSFFQNESFAAYSYKSS